MNYEKQQHFTPVQLFVIYIEIQSFKMTTMRFFKFKFLHSFLNELLDVLDLY